MQNFFEYLNSPQAQRGLDMIAGISPRERAQIMMEENKIKAYRQQEAAQQQLGQIMSQGGLTDDAIAEMWTVSPEYAIKLIEMKRAQEEQAMRNQLLQGAAADPSGLILGGMALGDTSLIQGGSALMALQEKQGAAAREKAAAQRLSGASQGGGYLSSGLDVDLSGVGGQAQETLPPIDGLESVPQANDLQSTIDALRQERTSIARSDIAGTKAAESAIADIDSQIKGIEASPEYAGQMQFAKDKAKLEAEQKEVLDSMTSKLPSLVETVNRLSNLSDSATYTMGGKAVDFLSKQAGVTTEGAAAAKEYDAIVNNQILPLLRDTFGAAFTQKEGETLKATLGGTDMSPIEKQRVLKAFIAQKMNDLSALGNRFGKDTSFITKAAEKLRLDAGTIAPTYSEGQTATNPQTGQKLIFRGGQWQAM